MISFKDYLEEMSSQEEFSNVIKNVPKHKHDDFRKTYNGLRKKGVAGRSAMMQAHSLHRESVELEELSDMVKSNYKDKATPDIIKKLLKGDKHRAVKRAKTVSKLDKEIKEAKWSTPDKQPAKDLQKGESVYVKHPDNGYQMVTCRYQRTETNPSGKAKPGHPHGHLIMLNKELPGRATKLYWAPHHEVFRDIEDGWPMAKPVKEEIDLDENMGGWNHKGANVTGNKKPVDPNWQSPEEKQKAQMLAHIKARKELAMKRQAEMDADIAKNPVTLEEQKRADKLLAGALKTGKFMKDKMGA